MISHFTFLQMISRRVICPMLIGFFALITVSCSDDEEEPQFDPPLIGSCSSVPATGRLTIENPGADQTYRYITSGGGIIRIDFNWFVLVEHEDWNNFAIEYWGIVDVENRWLVGNHENLNGKHIKDKFGRNRTLIFPDGAKLTMTGTGKYTRLESVSIYDGDFAVHINAWCNVVEYAASNASVAQSLDSNQVDGETADFTISGDYLYYRNIYQEDTPGNKVEDVYNLGRLYRPEPNQIDDYYDDPDLSYT